MFYPETDSVDHFDRHSVNWNKSDYEGNVLKDKDGDARPPGC